MENASKALLIAAEILIAMAVLTMGIYLYTTFNNISNDYNEEFKTKKILEFNQKFLKIQGREDITTHEIFSLAYYAKDQEKREENKVAIYIGNLNLIKLLNGEIFSGGEEGGKYWRNLYLNADFGYDNKYKVKSITYNEVGMINKIIFKNI